jgi:hypothetical protein
MPHVDGKCHAFATYLARDSGGGLRRFVEFRQRPQTLCALLSQWRRQSGAVKLARAKPDLFARKLHGWSLYGLSAIRNLTCNAGVLSPEVDATMEKFAGRCERCPATGNNVCSRGLRHVSLRKHWDEAVNRALQMDRGDFIVSHRPMTKQLGQVVADERSTYGELDPVASRPQEHAQLSLTKRWTKSWITGPGLSRQAHGRILSNSTCQTSLLATCYIRSRTNEAGKHTLKARLVLHGNKEQAVDEIRSDAASIHFSLIRMILTISAMMNFLLAGVDAKKAHHQSGRAPRNIMVRPPAECIAARRSIWVLLNLPYGLVDSGQQLQLRELAVRDHGVCGGSLHAAGFCVVRP